MACASADAAARFFRSFAGVVDDVADVVGRDFCLCCG
jgi:hypothetical protein